MKIAFLDLINWDYTVDTPYGAPLGGSQSALCYLAERLAASGVEVTLINGTTTPGRWRGVEHLSAPSIRLTALPRYDVMVVFNYCEPQIALRLRAALPGVRLVFWNQHAHDQTAVEFLKDPAAKAAFDHYVFISQWQAANFAKAFAMEPARISVLGNAVSPAFQSLFSEGEAVLPAKARPPVLAYTSTPFRGLEILLAAFPAIRRAVPGARLQVYSSMQVYQQTAEQDAFAALYETCRNTEGVDYVGSLPQPELAGRLKAATLLAYPNIFAETFCTAALEAMAAGCTLVTSRLGALPETTAGFARLMDPPGDRARHAELFAEEAVAALAELSEDRLQAQLRHVRETGTWEVRARQWVRLFQALAAGSGSQHTD